MTNNKYTQYFSTALLAAKEAGRAILEVYGSEFTVEHKDDRSPLTEADRRSHDIIMKHLSQMTNHQSSIPILSEEGRDIPYEERKKWDIFWLVDPLDGTKEFIKRNGEFTVNIALIHGNAPVLGVIYVPVKDTFYFASTGLGSYKSVRSESVTNDIALEALLEKSQRLPMESHNSQIAVSDSPATGHRSQITIVGSRSHATRELEEFTEEMRKKYRTVAFISAGSSLKFCLVAEGTADVYPRFGPTMEWDTAAGQSIVEESGGTVINAESKEPLTYNKEDLLNPSFIVKGA